MKNNDFENEEPGFWEPPPLLEEPEELHSLTEALYEVPNSKPNEAGLVVLPAIVGTDMITLPNIIAPIMLTGDVAVDAARFAASDNRTVALFLLKNTESEEPTWGDVYPFGVEAAVSEPFALPEGGFAVLAQGRRRIELVDVLDNENIPLIAARVLEEGQEPIDKETEALMSLVLKSLNELVSLDESIPEEAYIYALNANTPGWLADLGLMAVAPTREHLLEYLKETNPHKRLLNTYRLLAEAIDRHKLEEEIHEQVQSRMDKGQREAYLREQIRAIQDELGEGDFWAQEIKALRERIAKANLPEEARKRAEREVERMAQMPPMTPEVGIMRTYVEWILDLPWSASTEDNLDIKHAAEVLDEHHYGLPRAKERILEYIAVRSLKPKHTRQPILCFVGPPGTGKTSLGKSIAEALGRKFVRVSLGGVRDEAEIRGHRRTYIGALPGRILQTMKRAGTINPVFMLDEIDKLGTDFRGDPSSALLEVLDPEQNYAFSDHYLEIPYDLSQVIFITTANTLATIPPALLDRMEVIEFPGYVEEEKIHIAQRFLIPRQVEESGLEAEEIAFTEAALRRIIREYTDEAGVRNLEREIGRICRKVARLKAEGKRFPRRITPQAVERFLGPPQFFDLDADKVDEIGVANGLAWTVTGGAIMPVEVLLMEGKGNLQITGQLGDVMQESVKAALSYLRAHAADFGLEAKVFEETDIHLHVPEGAVPKDGPSAGVTIATALVSAFTRRPVRHDVAMTGEITLRGKVLPVGGVREKVLAAHRHGLKTVLLPWRNMKDLNEVPKSALQALKIIPVHRLDEVLEHALTTPRNS